MKLTNLDLERAIIFATEAHKGQTRKGDGRPYILHPIAVMNILNDIKKSNNPYLIAIVAICHDIVEDTDVTLEDIARFFGYNVAAIVGELTSDKDAIKSTTKAKYLAQKMLNMTSYSLRIKLADRLHNLQDTAFMTTEFKNKYSQETIDILNELKKRKLTKTHLKLIKGINKQIKFLYK